jgi:hypothetical protein
MEPQFGSASGQLIDQLNNCGIRLVQLTPPAVLQAALAENAADPPSITDALGCAIVVVTVTGLIVNIMFAEEFIEFPVVVTLTWHGVD